MSFQTTLPAQIATRQLAVVDSWGGKNVVKENIIGEVSDFIVSLKNEIVVLDYQANQILFFDKKGNCIRWVGQKGHGPNE